MCNTFVGLNPELRYSQQKTLHALVKSSKSGCSQTSQQFLFFFSCYFTGSGARKQGQVQAAFALLHFNDCLHCCHQQRKSPRFEKCKRMLLGCKHTMPHRHTHVHIIMLTHNAIKTPQTNGQECTHTCEHSCCSTIRSARYNSVV